MFAFSETEFSTWLNSLYKVAQMHPHLSATLLAADGKDAQQGFSVVSSFGDEVTGDRPA